MLHLSRYGIYLVGKTDTHSDTYLARCRVIRHLSTNLAQVSRHRRRLVRRRGGGHRGRPCVAALCAAHQGVPAGGRARAGRRAAACAACSSCSAAPSGWRPSHRSAQWVLPTVALTDHGAHEAAYATAVTWCGLRASLFCALCCRERPYGHAAAGCHAMCGPQACWHSCIAFYVNQPVTGSHVLIPRLSRMAGLACQA